MKPKERALAGPGGRAEQLVWPRPRARAASWAPAASRSARAALALTHHRRVYQCSLNGPFHGFFPQSSGIFHVLEEEQRDAALREQLQPVRSLHPQSIAARPVENTALTTSDHSHRGIHASLRNPPIPGPASRVPPLAPPRKGGPIAAGAEPAWSAPRPTASRAPWAAPSCSPACSSRPSAAASAGPTWTRCSTSRRRRPIATAASCRSGRAHPCSSSGARGRGWPDAGCVAGGAAAAAGRGGVGNPQGSSAGSCQSRRAEPGVVLGWCRRGGARGLWRQRLPDAVFALQWDPMITTLPGLYLLSVGVVKPAAWLLGWTGSVVCSVGMLRFINLLFSAGNFYLLYLLLFKIHQKNKVRSK